MQKTASARLTEETINGKYGPFQAYIVRGDARDDTYRIKDQLKSLGFSFFKDSWWVSTKKLTPQQLQFIFDTLHVEDRRPGVRSDSPPSTPVTPAPQPQVQQPQKKGWDTENPEMTKWYGFPINKSIYSFEFEMEDSDNDKHTLVAKIDRGFVAKQEYGKIVKSREYKGLPQYKISIFDKETNEKVAGTTSTSKEKWGTYDEDRKMEFFKNFVLERFAEKEKSKMWISSDLKFDSKKRTPEFVEFISNFIKDEELQKRYASNFTLHLDEGEYAGDYNIGFSVFGDDPQTFGAFYVDTSLDRPDAPHETLLGEVSLYKVHSVDELSAEINKVINSPNAKSRYLKYLQSFPYLESQKQTGMGELNEVRSFIDNPDDWEAVLRKLIEKGYIRPHKRQKQMGGGLTMGDEIKWVIDSKKIVNDVYSYGFNSKMPGYFYAVVAYYVHRQVRGISSWTDMMLVDTIGTWLRTLKRFGLDLSFGTIEHVVTKIGNSIVSKIYGKETKQERDRKFREWWNGEETGETSQETAPPTGVIADLASFAERFGIDTTDIENNLKGIYRVLVKNLHPDTEVDPVKKRDKEEQFKLLQGIWDRIPEQYKTASTWYEYSMLKTS